MLLLFRVLLSHCSENLETSKELVEIIRKKEELERKNLDLILKYNQLLKDIKNKWDNLNDNLSSVPAENEQVAK